MSDTMDYDKSVISKNPCFNFLNKSLLLEIHGIMDPPANIKAEELTYNGPLVPPSRLSYTIENLKIWQKIYNNGLKYDIFFFDNSSEKVFLSAYMRISNQINFTTSWITHWNRNPINEMVKHGGEKSGLILFPKFIGAGIGDYIGYDNILHWNVRYTPDENYKWVEILKEFNDKNLDLLIVPSRFGKRGFNSNCMIVKSSFWRLWSRMWDYYPKRLNIETLDIYESLQKIGYVNGPDDQPYDYVNKEKMNIWINPPYEWYRKTAAVKYVETKNGYKIE